MANEKHLEILRQGVEVWNRWREENPDIQPDLSMADLPEAHLSGANLREADLSDADLTGAHLDGAHLERANLGGVHLERAHLTAAKLLIADLFRANLRRADLGGADLRRANVCEATLHETKLRRAKLRGASLGGAHLDKADLREADLREANLDGAHLREADLSAADLSAANLRDTDLSAANLSAANLTGATLIHTNLTGADLTGCWIFGVSAWKLNLVGASQADLVISDHNEPIITVDNLEVAQFIYLLLNNERIRDTIDTITSKVVLILGRFTPERKAILDAIRDELRQRDYLPILFDFEGPSNRDLTETISILAHMARFVIADVTDAKSIPAELERIVPGLPSVPVQPLIASSDNEFALFEHIRRYPWVLDTYQYDSLDELLDTLKEKVIDPAERKAKELREKDDRPTI